VTTSLKLLLIPGWTMPRSALTLLISLPARTTFQPGYFSWIVAFFSPLCRTFNSARCSALIPRGKTFKRVSARARLRKRGISRGELVGVSIACHRFGGTLNVFGDTWQTRGEINLPTLIYRPRGSMIHARRKQWILVKRRFHFARTLGFCRHRISAFRRKGIRADVPRMRRQSAARASASVRFGRFGIPASFNREMPSTGARAGEPRSQVSISAAINQDRGTTTSPRATPGAGDIHQR